MTSEVKRMWTRILYIVNNYLNYINSGAGCAEYSQVDCVLGWSIKTYLGGIFNIFGDVYSATCDTFNLVVCVLFRAVAEFGG